MKNKMVCHPHDNDASKHDVFGIITKLGGVVCIKPLGASFPSIRSYVSVQWKHSFQTLEASQSDFICIPFRLYLHPIQTLIAFHSDFKRKNNNLTL